MMITTNKKFVFSKENLKEVENILSKYPEGRKKSAVLPLLHLAQRQNDGWVSKEIVDHVAEIIDVAPIRVYEVVTFYTMFNLKPIGKFHIQVCGTTPCMLRGSENLLKLCKEKLGIDLHETTKDMMFTVSEVECLGGCANAPVIQINDDYFEDLTVKNFEKILDDLKAGKKVTIGSQTGRNSSEPATAKKK